MNIFLIMIIFQSLTLFNIRQIIHKEFPEHKAGLLGENLGIPHDNVETLKHDSGNDSNKFFSKVITYWLHSDREKSWRKLADAVELCNYEDVADKIREKYVKLATAEHRLPQGIYFRGISAMSHYCHFHNIIVIAKKSLDALQWYLL